MTDICRVGADRWQELEALDQLIRSEAPDILEAEPEIALQLQQYTDVITSGEAEFTLGVFKRRLPVESQSTALFGGDGNPGLLATRGLRLVVAAKDKLMIYSRPETAYLYEPRGVNYYGGYLLAIAGTVPERLDGLPGHQYLITPHGTVLKAQQLGRDIKSGDVELLPSRMEIVKQLDDKPIKRLPPSTMDGMCGTCTQFNCRHGRFAGLDG